MGMSKNMAETHLRSLSRIVTRYKNEQQRPAGFVETLLHYHDKNPDAKFHIQFLDRMAERIKATLAENQWNQAQLGTIAILKALFMDPNPEGQVFNYLVKKLELDEETQKLLHKIKPGLIMDPTDPNYLKITYRAIELCKPIIESSEFKEKFPPRLLKDLTATIVAELDYVHKVLNSVMGSLKP